MKSAGNSRIAVGRRIIHGDAEIDFHHVGPDVIDELRPRVVPAVVPAGAVDARGVDVEHFRRAIAIAVADTFVVATIVERRHEPLRSISNVVVVFDLHAGRCGPAGGRVGGYETDAALSWQPMFENLLSPVPFVAADPATAAALLPAPKGGR